MSRLSSPAAAVTLLLSLTVGMSLAVRSSAEADKSPVVRAVTRVEASQRLLLVFYQSGTDVPYRIVDSSATEDDIERHMNEMAGQNYLYQATIPVSASPVPIPRAVAVPGLTQNVRGVGSGRGQAGVGEALRLVFHSRGLNRYRVVGSGTSAGEVQEQMNAVSVEGYDYHTAIIVAAHWQDLRVGMAGLGDPAAVGVPGVTSNVLSLLPPAIHAPAVAHETAWTTRVGSRSEYRVVDAGSWLRCEEAAREEGAHLVTINGEDEQAWLTKTYRRMGRLWIGFTDEGSEGVWWWTSGEEASYTNWASRTREPSNQWDGGENFAHMNWGPSGEWTDLGPSSPEWSSVTRGIIERPLGDQ